MTIQQSTDAPGTPASARLTSAVADAGARAAGEVVARAVVDVVAPVTEDAVDGVVSRVERRVPLHRERGIGRIDDGGVAGRVKRTEEIIAGGLPSRVAENLIIGAGEGVPQHLSDADAGEPSLLRVATSWSRQIVVPGVEMLETEDEGAPETWSVQRTVPEWKRQTSPLVHRSVVERVSMTVATLTQVSPSLLRVATWPDPQTVRAPCVTGLSLPALPLLDGTADESLNCTANGIYTNAG